MHYPSLLCEAPNQQPCIELTDWPLRQLAQVAHSLFSSSRCRLRRKRVPAHSEYACTVTTPDYMCIHSDSAGLMRRDLARCGVEWRAVAWRSVA